MVSVVMHLLLAILFASTSHYLGRFCLKVLYNGLIKNGNIFLWCNVNKKQELLTFHLKCIVVLGVAARMVNYFSLFCRMLWVTVMGHSTFESYIVVHCQFEVHVFFPN